MAGKYDLVRFYEIINGAVDGYHFDMYSFQFNDFPEWVKDEDCNIIYVNDMEENTPDLIAYEFYGDERFFWVICLANRIMDPFTELPVGRKLCIPKFTSVIKYVLKFCSDVNNGDTSSSINATVSLN